MALDDGYVGVVSDLLLHMVELVGFEPGVSVDIGSSSHRVEPVLRT